VIRRIVQARYLYLCILPAVAFVALFCYVPAASGLWHSMYEWNGSDISIPVGWRNFQEIIVDPDFWRAFRHVMIFVAASIVKLAPSVVVALVLFHVRRETAQYAYRVIFVIPMVIPAIVGVLIWQFIYNPQIGVMNALLRLLGHPGGIVWLGDPKWIIPAILFIGFPWVGTVGVLILLAGLQNIPESVFEAAALDGVTPFARAFRIELPLIMRQIKLNIVLGVIGTLQGYAFILLLLDENGGTGFAADVPGLYMYRHAFRYGELGYASAVGVILFVVILGLTIFNMKVIKAAD